MKQSVARKDVYKGAAQARRLLANVHVSPSVFASTIEDSEIEQVVSYRLASEAMTVGSLTLEAMQPYYLVASKFENRYYVVAKHNGKWSCSLGRDERLLAMLVMKVIEYATSLEVAA